MLSRLTGRLITSPVAFLVAGLLDLAVFWLGWARRSSGRAVRRRLR
jgi:hypothetical protein